MASPSTQGARREAADQQRGLTVFIALAVLTAVEYVIAVSIDAGAALVILLTVAALGKAWAIINYFMHLPKLWHGEGGH